MASHQSTSIYSLDHRPKKMVKFESTQASDLLPDTADELSQQSWSFAAINGMDTPTNATNNTEVNTIPARPFPNTKPPQPLPLTNHVDGVEGIDLQSLLPNLSTNVSNQTDVVQEQVEQQEDTDEEDAQILSLLRNVLIEDSSLYSPGKPQTSFEQMVGRLHPFSLLNVTRVLNENRTELSQLLASLNFNSQNVGQYQDASDNGDTEGTEDRSIASSTPGQDVVGEDAVGEGAADGEVSDGSAEQEIAQEVVDAAAAAEADRADAAIDEQTRWIQELSRNNPEEFRRLVDADIIDLDFLDHINQLNDAVADTNHGEQNNIGDSVQVPPLGEDSWPSSNEMLWATPDNDPVAAGDQDGNIQEIAGDDNLGQANDAATQFNPIRHDDHFLWIHNRADGQEENTVCPACQCEFSESELLVFLNCGHKWCADCLNSNYRMALRNRNDFPPRCCDIPLEHDSVQHFLNEDLLIDLITKMEEYDDPDPIYCQTPKCQRGYIPRQQIEGQWAACSECSRSTCVECKAGAADHSLPNVHPKVLTQLDEELAEKEGWKQCPGCKNLVEKMDGCDFMHCDCGHEFCYGCGGTLMNNMPCPCQGTPAWVRQMNDEAADDGEEGSEEEGADDPDEERSGGGGGDDDDGDDDSDDESGWGAEGQENDQENHGIDRSSQNDGQATPPGGNVMGWGTEGEEND